MRPIFLSLGLALALAACGGFDAGGNEQGAKAGAASEPVPDNASNDPENAVVPLAIPSPQPLAALPQPFYGRWGLVPDDCDPRRADAKGLMTVAADRLTFYESQAVPGNVRTDGPQRVTVSLAFTGEGQRWTRKTVLSIEDGGRTLVRTDTDPPNALRYQRCPASQETTP